MLELELSADLYECVRSSLLPEGDEREHAAFLFARPESPGRLVVVDVEPLRADAFDAQTWGYLALRDGALQEMIVRAPRARLALVEAHSHPFAVGPEVVFSPYDCDGLSTTAPQICWRLPGRPYGALVVGQDAYDALYWAERSPAPSGVMELIVDGVRNEPSGESFRQWRSHGGQV